MKTRSSLLCIAILLTALNVADAQYLGASGPASGLGGPAGMGGPSAIGRPQFRRMSGDVQAGLPGRMWFETNLADQGLGYNGSYLTLGGKNRMFEDFLDGRWLAEAELHHSIDEDEADFFANVGIERVFSIPAAHADVSVGAWYDYNGQTDAEFSQDLHQISISGKIKTPRWDLMGNGYFPIGNTDYTFGDITGVIPFAAHSILTSAAFDSAQQGFDATFRFRPKQLAFANGNIDLGGYGYKSDLVDFYGGGRARLGFQALRGATVSAEVNYDERFKTTGLLSLGWTFGSNGGYGGEYGGIGRDLEKTERNDHIVRVTSEAAYAINPDTGLRYHAVHVDNLAEAGGDGTFERPFRSTAEAEAASLPGDLIYVDEGDRSNRLYDTGLVLKDDQQLRGTGPGQFIRLDNGELFNISYDPTLVAPIISNLGDTEVVLLANNNTVGGVTIDGTGAGTGIRGDGVTDGTIDTATAQGATGAGVDLRNISGDWRLVNNTFQNNGAEGLKIENTPDATSNFLIQNNTATNNLTDGISLTNFSPGSLVIDANTTSNNLRNGLAIDNFINANDISLNITNHTSDANSDKGIAINGGNGALNIFTPTITNNLGTGIEIRNWVSNSAEQFTVISGLGDTVGNVLNNGLGSGNVDIILDQPGLTQNVLVTNVNLNDGGGVGLKALSEGIDTVLNINVFDNVTINNNVGDGIQFLANNSGIINTIIGSSDLTTDRMQINNNALTGGSGISLVARGVTGQPTSEINAVISNVGIQNDESLIFGPTTTIFIQTTGISVESLENAVVDVAVADSDIGAPAQTFGLDTTTGVVGIFDNDGHGRINKLSLARLNIVAGSNNASGNIGTGVAVATDDDTLTDILITDSTIRPNSTQGPAISNATADNTVFNDTVGNEGIVIVANGAANIGAEYYAGPGVTIGAPVLDEPSLSSVGGPFFDVTSDGVLDNLTRVTLLNNTVRDFTFDGVDISTMGDAQLALQISGNTIYNNGAGLNHDSDGDGIYNETANSAGPAIDQLLFFDGVNIDAFEASTISTRITNNLFQDNFERGLSLNTFQRATINALVQGNGFVGNDRGIDVDFTNLPATIQGQDGAPVNPIVTAAFADIEAINNEEYYFRIHESLVFVQNLPLIDGGPAENDLFNPLDPATPLEADDPGVLIPGNVGADIFGNGVPLGVADMNIAFIDNGLQNAVDIQDFSVAPGVFLLAAEGSNTPLPITGIDIAIASVPPVPTTSGIVDLLITNEQLLFIGQGFALTPAP